MNENWHIVGCIQENVAKKLGMQGRTPIWINDKILKHIEDRHGNDLKARRTTARAFVHRVVIGFDSAYRQKDGTIVLAITSSRTAMVAYIIMERDKNNFWRIRSAHNRNTTQLQKYRLLWIKK